MVQSGNIVVFNVTKGYWFAAAQRFFTGMPYSHAAIGFGEVKGDESVLEALFAIAITPFKKARESTTTDFEVWRVKNVPQTRIEEAVKRAFERWAGETYGFAQILWFMYRWLNETIGRDVRKQGNWFPDHLICSEVAYNYLWDLSEQLPSLRKKLEEWNSNCFHAGDVHTVCAGLPEVFELIERRGWERR
jgi:hypothetical protein